MKRHPSNPICDLCGKFMSYSDMDNAVVYVPYGNSYELEPRDPLFIHRRCWGVATNKMKQIIFNIAYQINIPRPANTLPERTQ